MFYSNSNQSFKKKRFKDKDMKKYKKKLKLLSNIKDYQVTLNF